MTAKLTIEKFWERVDKNGPTPESPRKFRLHPIGECWELNDDDGLFYWVAGPCWIWQGPKNLNGYGVVGNRPAHVIAFEDYHGCKLGNGWDGAHCCDTPACVNPTHVTPASHRMNMYDRKAKGRADHSQATKDKIGKANALALKGKRQPAALVAKRAASNSAVRTAKLKYKVEDAAREYEAGATLKSLANKHNVSIASMYRRLSKFGITSRLGANQFSRTAA